MTSDCVDDDLGGRRSEREHACAHGARAGSGTVMSVGFALLVLATYAIQVAIGFGGTLFALSFGAFLFGDVAHLVTVLVPASLVVTGALVATRRDEVRGSLLVRGVLPATALGVAVAQIVGPWLGRAVALETIYAVFVAGIAVRELTGRSPIPAAHGTVANVDRPTLLAAGVVHGVFASGGPLVVAAMARSGLSKGEFRSTLCALWLAMNTGLSVTWTLTGRIDAASVAESFSLVPSMLGALVLGGIAHRRVDERRFRMLVAYGLLVSGLALLLRG